MYKNLILRGTRLGMIGGLYLSFIYAVLVCILVAASSSHSILAVGYFFIYLILGLLIGVMPSMLIGAISGTVVGILVSLEIKLLTRLGKDRIIFWRFIGLASVLTLLRLASEYKYWILNPNNASVALMIAMYFGGLIWVGWRLYRVSPANLTRSRLASLANKINIHLPSRTRVINVVCIILGLVLTLYSASMIFNFIRYGGRVWLEQVVFLVVGFCSIVGLRTLNKWGA